MKKQYISIIFKVYLLLLISFLILTNEAIAQPVFSGVPDNEAVACDAIPVPATPTATDNCEGEISITLNETITSINGGCGGSYNLKRTWTATNDCNEQSVASQILRVRDKQGPNILGVPDGITVECDVIPDPADVTAEDNCSGIFAIELLEERIEITNNPCNGRYNLKRTWTATDSCGNSNKAIQIIKVRDTTDPVLVGVPDGITVECDQVPFPASVMAEDNCSGTFEAELEERIIELDNGCNGKYNLRRIWTAVDSCGNKATASQLIKVRDTQDPILETIPENIMVTCADIPDAPIIFANDNCSGRIEAELDQQIIPINNNPCSGRYNIKRTWTVTDSCGNAVSGMQVIRVRDNSLPALVGVPTDATVSCENVPDIGEVTADNQCGGEVTITPSEVKTNGLCPNSYILTRTWIATNDCGFSTTQSQTLTVIDETAPILSATPEDVIVDCTAIPDAPTLEATDNCDTEVTVIYRQDTVRFENGCVNKYNLKRVWKATDNCGNETKHIQLVKVRDNEAPSTETVVEDIMVDCHNITPPPTLVVTDNCDAPEDIDINLEETLPVFLDEDCSSKYNFRRIWTLTDQCGNSSTLTQFVRVRDTIDPVLSLIPDNIKVSCDNIPEPADVTATDNCDDNVIVNWEDKILTANTDCPNDYNIKRIWTAIDACGNKTTGSQTIRVRDEEAPILSAAPDNVTVTCDAIPAAATLTATDACEGEVTVSSTETSTQAVSEGDCSYQITRTWTATDACGNEASSSQVITVEDNENPVLSATPANETVECDAVPVPADITASDNCSTGLTPAYVQERTDGDCANNYTLTRTWSVSDACGNSATHTQIITVEDTTPPVVSCEASTGEIRCTGDIESFTFGDAWNAANIRNLTACATDNCSGESDITVTSNYDKSNIVFACGNTGILEATYTISDACGNETTKVGKIKIIDITPPVLSAEAPANATVECDGIPAAATITATDACDENVTVIFSETSTKEAEGVDCSYEITRTWTATDACGNEASTSQTIIVEDTTPPVLTCEVNTLNSRCSGNIQSSNYGDAWNTANIDRLKACASDNCSDASEITVTSDYDKSRFVFDCAYKGTLETTFTISDACGNEITVIGKIVIIDETAPVLSAEAPANATVECDAIPAAATITATDACDENVTVIFSETSTKEAEGVDCSYEITRTWTATDACGNEASTSQTIIVEDTTPPVLTCEVNTLNSRCSGNIQSSNYGDAWNTANIDRLKACATDNCSDASEITVTSDYDKSRFVFDCAYRGTLETTFMISDACGNEITVIGKIVIIDETAPVLSAEAPANVTVECDAIPGAATITATDACDENVIVIFSETSTKEESGVDCSYEITRIWTATDACGNEVSTSQVITAVDNSAPVLSETPADITVDCDAIPDAPMITATDACEGTTTVALVETPTIGDCGGNYTITRTWSSTDACDNKVEYIQTITVQDTTPPVLSEMPTDITVECDAIPDLPTITASDNCDVGIRVEIMETATTGSGSGAGACASTYQLIRTWTASDECGNQTQHTQTISVEDTTPPVMADMPTNITVSCGNIPAVPSNLTMSDNCNSNVTMDFKETVTEDGCDNTYTLTRTWTATDACGNSAKEEQIITVIDDIKPVLTGVPANVTVSCDAIPAVATPTASDNCDSDVTISFGQSKLQGDCENEYTLARTWTATDNCGNVDIQFQTITVIDNTAPIFSNVAANVTVECDAIPAVSNPTVTDNCEGAVRLDFSDAITDDTCSDTYTLTRTWTATDVCGNISSVSQVIKVQDTTNPILVGIPAGVTVECDAIPAVASPTATDNCDEEVMIDFTDAISDQTCDNTYTLTRTWTATDNCGNVSSASQVINVQDTIDPILSGVPADITIDCDAIPTIATPTASDNCETDVSIEFTDAITNQTCVGNYTLTRTWTATDNCGNSSSDAQIITVIDTIKPVIVGVPENVTVECDDIPAVATPTATDNCSENIAVVFNESMTNEGCLSNYSIARTWTATDACGNETVATQIITVDDNTPPVLAGVPADITVECDAIPAAATPSVSDNCDSDIIVDFAEASTTVDCANGYTIIRTWTAEDDCGNQTQASQTITVKEEEISNRVYCPAEGRNTFYLWIEHVILGNINNESGRAGGYSDYTNLSTDIAPGSVETLILSPRGRNRYLVYWSVWIDFNRDGDFNDENEELFTRSSTTTSVLSIRYRMPSNFEAGETRMRVAMKYGRPARSCESFSYGEVEDYTVNLLPSSGSLNDPIAESRNQDYPIFENIEKDATQPIRELNLGGEAALKVFPNPVRTKLKVQLSNYQNKEGVIRIYNNLGQTVYQTDFDNQSAQEYFTIDVQEFQDGVYFLSMENETEPPLVQKFYKN